MINNKNLIAYSLLAFCLAFVGLPIYIYLPNYYASNFGISLQNIALILLFTRAIDAIQDPIFGILSDKFSKLKRKIIFFTAPFLGISFLLLFFPLPFFSTSIWLVIFLILTYSLFSLIYINYQSFAVSFSKDYNLKTKIISFREVGFIFGIICAAALPAILFNLFDEVKSFLIIGVFYLATISIFATIFYFFAPKNIHQTKEKFNFKKIIQNQWIKKFLSVFFLNAISSSIPAVLILFFIEKILGTKNLSGLFLILYFVGLLIGTIFWAKISKILNNKVKAWIFSISFSILAFFWCYFLSAGDVVFYALICFFSGFGFGGDFCLGYSILTDIIQKEKLESDETTIFGICNFLIKISLTLASAILIYFIGHLENNLAKQSSFILLSYTILPIIFRSASAFLLYKNFLQKSLK